MLLFRRILLAACVALGASTGMTQAAPPAKKAPGPALVFDAKDGRVLLAENADTPWYPASLTKLMTAYVMFDLLKRGEATLTSEFVISPYANSQPKSRAGVGAGKRINVKDALNGLMVQSANDLAVALAEAVAGSESEFVEEMNQTALRLGMVRTQFVNPHGLPKEGQATTARDMGLLARALIRDFPEWLPLDAMTDTQIGRRTFHTHNKLLDNFDGADGMKTGFTCGAGYNIVASATRGNRKIVAVVLGDRNGGERSVRAMKLLEAGFATQPGQMIDTKTLEPEPVSGEELLDVAMFTPAQNVSEQRPIKNCFASAGPAPKLIEQLAARPPADPKKPTAEAQQSDTKPVTKEVKKAATKE